MRIATAITTEPSPDRALAEIAPALTRTLGGAPSMVFGVLNAGRDPQRTLDAVRATWPGVPFMFHTSCNGLLTDQGFADDPHALACLAVRDPDGRYGVASAEKGVQPRAATRATLERALARTGAPFAQPALVWTSGGPGDEESMLAAIDETLGGRVPVFGGSSADDAVAGNWFQLTPDGTTHDGVAMAVLAPSTPLTTAFLSGYAPSGPHGRVTRVEGRTVWAIDDRPAVEVYEAWTGLSLTHVDVLAATSLQPLGRPVGRIEDVRTFALSHPAAVVEGGGLQLFTEVTAGEEIYAMRGSTDSLVERAARVAEAVSVHGDLEGALFTYCAGCRLTVGERMPEVARGIQRVLDGRPFLGQFTFGEQGCLTVGRNQHANLMISAVGFRRLR